MRFIFLTTVEVLETLDESYQEVLAILSELSKLLDAARASKECRGLALEAFLIKPVQRLLKYPLFFRELLQATPGVARVPSPDPDARRRRTPSPEPESDEPDVMPCHKAHRKELRDRKRQEERRFRKLLAKAREESEQRTPHKGTSRAIARVMRDLAAATAARDAASRISQQEEEEAVAPPRFRGPLREDAAVEKRRVALELLRDMRCGL